MTLQNRGLETRSGDIQRSMEIRCHWIGFVGKILTGNHGFYHQIFGVFLLKFSHHPIL